MALIKFASRNLPVKVHTEKKPQSKKPRRCPMVNLITYRTPSSFFDCSFFSGWTFAGTLRVSTKLPKLLLFTNIIIKKITKLSFIIQNGKILKWPYLSQKISMNLVLQIILKLLSRPVVCANFQRLEANICFTASGVDQGHSTIINVQSFCQCRRTTIFDSLPRG